MSGHIHKAHNVSALLYHLVCPTKYRRAVITGEVDAALKRVCFDSGNCYEITFLEIGADRDHVHFLVQSVPTYSPTKIVTTIKSLTAREVFLRVPSVKEQLWGGRSGRAATTSIRSVATAVRKPFASTWPDRGGRASTISCIRNSLSCSSGRALCLSLPDTSGLAPSGASLFINLFLR